MFFYITCFLVSLNLLSSLLNSNSHGKGKIIDSKSQCQCYVGENAYEYETVNRSNAWRGKNFLVPLHYGVR